MRGAILTVLLGALAGQPGASASPIRSISNEDGCLPGRQRVEIERALSRSLGQLRADHVLSDPVETAVVLTWPLRAAGGLADPGYDQISNFVDHDPAMPDHLLDYECGDRTYDILGNHRGTDIQIWPFPWLKMANDQVQVVAAAPGTIVLKQDGFYDKNCSCVGTWNAVYVSHADGSVAWYGHLKKDSLTAKAVGATVAAGEYLGVVGSSGCSTMPHLHFELHDAEGVAFDPFAGSCNPTDSWWLGQRPYHDSAINEITTGLASAISATPCGIAEQPNEQSVFAPGQKVYFTVYYRDTVAGQIATYRLLRPDGSLQESWNYALVATWDTHVKETQKTLSTVAPGGTWRLTVDYAGRVYERAFFVGGSPAGAADFTVSKTPAGVMVNWVASCGSPQAKAAIHVGILGDFYSHYPLGCDYAGGSALLTWLQLQGPRYFLVVPLSDNREGSYGPDSHGAERPPSDSPCAPQSIGCP